MASSHRRLGIGLGIWFTTYIHTHTWPRYTHTQHIVLVRFAVSNDRVDCVRFYSAFACAFVRLSILTSMCARRHTYIIHLRRRRCHSVQYAQFSKTNNAYVIFTRMLLYASIMVGLDTADSGLVHVCFINIKPISAHTVTKVAINYVNGALRVQLNSRREKKRSILT